MSKLKSRVIEIVKMIPYGFVASYGQVALMAGVPRGARMVGQILRNTEDDILAGMDDLPWWRVINNAGRISIKGTKYHTPLMQKEKLAAEGIEVKDDLTFDIEKYRFRPSPDQLGKMGLDDKFIDLMVEKFFI